MTTTINADNGAVSGSAGLKSSADSSGVLALQSNGTTALTTSGANVTVAGTLTTAAQGIAKASLPTGSVLQVVNATFSTAQTTTSTTYQASGLTVSITPTSSTSKILISASVPYDTYGGTINQVSLTLYRGATNLITNGFSLLSGGSGLNIQGGSSALSWLDSPATTSSTTYTIYFRVASGATGTPTARIFVDNYTGTLTAMEIAA